MNTSFPSPTTSSPQQKLQDEVLPCIPAPISHGKRRRSKGVAQGAMEGCSSRTKVGGEPLGVVRGSDVRTKGSRVHKLVAIGQERMELPTGGPQGATRGHNRDAEYERRLQEAPNKKGGSRLIAR